jgi:hypothetical protein
MADLILSALMVATFVATLRFVRRSERWPS